MQITRLAQNNDPAGIEIAERTPHIGSRQTLLERDFRPDREISK
jgi:hypothetical protein